MSTSSTRPRSLTVQSPSTAQARHFRPVRYQSKEELDRFFGITPVQKREQRLRVRETDGQVYFDWIEKDEWQHLLATGSLTSPSSANDRRRSSAATCLTLNSPLCPLSPARRATPSPGSTSLSPLAMTFDEVTIASAEGARSRRRRKRSDSDAAVANNRVDDRLVYSGKGERSTDWIASPAFKRRQSDSYDPLDDSPRSAYGGMEEESHEVVRIRIGRLPLEHRRLDQRTLDQAFAVHDPMMDLAPDASLVGLSRAHKPPTLLIPHPFVANAQLEDLPDDGLSSASSMPYSPSEYAHSTFDADGFEARRGTFGALELPQRTPVQLVAASTRRTRHHSDPTTSPPSSAAMEVLHSPAIAPLPKAQRTLRHAVSFDVVPRLPPSSDQAANGAWTQRQRWKSADNESVLSTSRSTASLCSQPARRARTLSGSDDTACFTALAPRTGARRFDPTRHAILSTLEHLAETTPASEPQREKTAEAKGEGKRGTGLRTGAHVYDGVDIPCASIHLHSDPEDNHTPAIALSLSSHKLRKLRKKHSSPPPTEPTQHARSASLASHPRGSSRWWTNILHT